MALQTEYSACFGHSLEPLGTDEGHELIVGHRLPLLAELIELAVAERVSASLLDRRASQRR